jgi:hypothetical protein
LAHPDLRDYHGARATALAQAFGMHLAKPPHDDPDLVQLLRTALDDIAALSSPFDGYLEAPRAVGVLHKRHGDAIAMAGHALRERLMELSIDLVATIWHRAADVTVSAAELAANGFDTATPPPDPSDYW